MKRLSGAQGRNVQLVMMFRMLTELRTGHRTVEYLAGNMEVSTRTIYRWLAALQEAHYPILTDGPRWWLAESWTQPALCSRCRAEQSSLARSC